MSPVLALVSVSLNLHVRSGKDHNTKVPPHRKEIASDLPSTTKKVEADFRGVLEHTVSSSSRSWCRTMSLVRSPS
jgi:hypothetical protein